jgi:hypothetical protein
MTSVNGSNKRRWVFRQFMPYVLTVPTLEAVLSATLIILLSTLYPSYTRLSLLLILLPGAYLLLKFLDWWARRIEIKIADNGRRWIIFKEGIWHSSEQPVSLSDFLVPTYRRSLLGRVFDYGDFDYSFMGGPNGLKAVGNYSMLRQLITSLGEEEPVPRRSPFGQLLSFVWAVTVGFIVIVALWVWRVLCIAGRVIARGQWDKAVRGWLPQLTSPRPDLSPTYRGFLQFCDCELLSNGRRLDMSHPPNSISQCSLQAYCSILGTTRVIVPDGNGSGSWIARPSIRNIRDIQRRIDPDLFERFIGQYQTTELRSEPVGS